MEAACRACRACCGMIELSPRSRQAAILIMSVMNGATDIRRGFLSAFFARLRFYGFTLPQRREERREDMTLPPPFGHNENCCSHLD